MMFLSKLTDIDHLPAWVYESHDAQNKSQHKEHQRRDNHQGLHESTIVVVIVTGHDASIITPLSKFEHLTFVSLVSKTNAKVETRSGVSKKGLRDGGKQTID